MPLNSFASAEQLETTPSARDEIPYDLEEELRAYGCQLIQQTGILLKLPQRTMATAQVLYQRFWFVSSFCSFSLQSISMGALFLSSKLEETPVLLLDLVYMYDYLISLASHSVAHNCGKRYLKSRHPPDQLTGKIPDFCYDMAVDYESLKEEVIVGEMQILKRLGFNTQVSLPYATMVNYLQLLGLTNEQIKVSTVDPQFTLQCRHDDSSTSSSVPLSNVTVTTRTIGFAQRAWSYLNDALQTIVYCIFPPHVIACAAIYLTAQTAIPPLALPIQPEPWWTLFDVDRVEMRAVCAHILRLYHPSGPASGTRQDKGGLSDIRKHFQVEQWIVDHLED